MGTVKLCEVPLTALIITISTIYCVMYLPKCGLPATSLLTFNAAVNFIKTFSNVDALDAIIKFPTVLLSMYYLSISRL